MTFFNDALREMESIQRDINNIFSRVGYTVGVSSYPLVNLYENENELILVAETPGMKKDDINISVTDKVLTLSGVCEEKRYGEKVRTLRDELPKGNFEKTFRLPLKIQNNKISASMVDGMLTR